MSKTSSHIALGGFRGTTLSPAQLLFPPATSQQKLLERSGETSHSKNTIAKMPQAQPELKKYMEKRIFCQLNGNRKVIGVLRGYDVFMNIVLDEAFEEKPGGEKVAIGMVVIRGNSVVMLEALERISDK